MNEEERAFMAGKDWDPHWALREVMNRYWGGKGWVYFVQSAPNGPTKIGYTEGEPQQRLAALQVGNPIPLRLASYIAGSREMERTIHDMFAPYRLQGEWFRGDAFGLPELIACCKSIRDAFVQADAEYFAEYGA